MKYTTPEISWHNKDPVLSVDVQPVANEEFYRLASGGTDSHVIIWHLKLDPKKGTFSPEPVTDLTKHQRAVNVVRWSPSGQYLASGDDDGNIIIWHRKADELAVMLNENNDKEKWSVYKILRGHKEDVYDISWSTDSNKLVSGSVDNTAIIWDLNKGSNNILTEHKGFVQGVSWDPIGQYVVTLSSDRTCRVYNDTGKQVKYRISKGQLPVPESHPLHGQIVRYYHDDTLKSFFRRLTFSPDGTLLLTPAGYLEIGEHKLYATYIFTTHSLGQPAVVIPSPKQCTVAVRCCPLLFELWEDGSEPVISLPYRIVIAIATYNTVVLYDTQQMGPFSIISNIHYTRLTDLSWSHDGRLLAVSSTDGFCSLISFEQNELGTVYKGDWKECNAEQPTDEIMEKSPTKPIDSNAKEKKEKKSSYLMQWAMKASKVDTPSETKSDSDLPIIIDDDDDDVEIIEPDSEHENSKKDVEIEKTAKDNNTESEKNKENIKQETTTVAGINVLKVKHSSSKTNTPTKSTSQHRKSRSEQQIDIIRFLKTPKEPKLDIVKDNKKPRIDENKLHTSVNLVEEENARDTWNCEQEMSVDAVHENKVVQNIVTIDDSQDIKLVLEDTVSEEQQQTNTTNTNLNCDEENKNKTHAKICDTQTKNVSDNSASKENVKINTASEENSKVTENVLRNVITVVPETVIVKKKVPFFTLSSPKHKKKPL